MAASAFSPLTAGPATVLSHKYDIPLLVQSAFSLKGVQAFSE